MKGLRPVLSYCETMRRALLARGGPPHFSRAASVGTCWREQFGKLAREAGLVWGGGWLVFKDRPHVELANWKKIATRERGEKR